MPVIQLSYLYRYDKGSNITKYNLLREWNNGSEAIKY